jgi:hypothetical protein
MEGVPAFFTHSQLQQESIHDFGDPLVLLLHPKEPMDSAISRFVFTLCKVCVCVCVYVFVVECVVGNFCARVCLRSILVLCDLGTG